MFSHLVTAAKGLFARNEQESDDLTTMVSATRQGVVGAAKSATEPAMNGKRKAESATTKKAEGQQTKRRKRDSLGATETTTDGQDQTPTAPSAQTKHMRFGSEEPELPQETQPEEIPETSNQKEDDDDSDDDAPEAIDNSAQLLKIKEHAKKLEVAKQMYKRRKLDERRKLQAKSTAKANEPSAPADDLRSESTTTLQGSITHDVRRRALPALLPDDILNAVPVERPPTPPAEDLVGERKKPNKLRFLDKTDKAPKDVRVGDVAIRVLDAPSTKKNNSQPGLAPKISKSGRNIKDNWLKNPRSTGQVNGLRRTAGGSSGFVRR
ncbi:U3 snoRNA associated [Penicillium lagena]|uniref:U3 snoRNA associated n=1 Tax=Penicillium lagena TaxID=94218 RepID=UPI00253FD2FA|nr:U3 snoRNA associated [Penicillium lagena]KAJ5604504.1 U3 snoRNA associated [Penicillium lagena]